MKMGITRSLEGLIKWRMYDGDGIIKVTNENVRKLTANVAHALFMTYLNPYIQSMS